MGMQNVEEKKKYKLPGFDVDPAAVAESDRRFGIMMDAAKGAIKKKFDERLTPRPNIFSAPGAYAQGVAPQPNKALSSPGSYSGGMYDPIREPEITMQNISEHLVPDRPAAPATMKNIRPKVAPKPSSMRTPLQNVTDEKQPLLPPESVADRDARLSQQAEAERAEQRSTLQSGVGVVDEAGVKKYGLGPQYTGQGLTMLQRGTMSSPTLGEEDPRPLSERPVMESIRGMKGTYTSQADPFTQYATKAEAEAQEMSGFSQAKELAGMKAAGELAIEKERTAGDIAQQRIASKAAGKKAKTTDKTSEIIRKRTDDALKELKASFPYLEASPEVQAQLGVDTENRVQFDFLADEKGYGKDVYQGKRVRVSKDGRVYFNGKFIGTKKKDGQ